MKLIYDPEPDALYIDLREGHVEESEEVAPDFVLDFDKDGSVLGIDIYSNVNKKVDLSRLQTDILSIGLVPRRP